MKRLFGWWWLDAERAQLIIPGTGQSVRYAGRVDDDADLGLAGNSDRHWMRFEYEDGECRYPLLVEYRNIQDERPRFWRPVVGRVDHVRSAALWRKETNSATANPPYGLWRRVDDRICGAFACRPRLEVVGTKPSRPAINGGWLNGRWTSELYCRGPRATGRRCRTRRATPRLSPCTRFSTPSASPRSRDAHRCSCWTGKRSAPRTRRQPVANRLAAGRAGTLPA